MNIVKRIWTVNPLKHDSMIEWCKHYDTVMSLLGSVLWIVQYIQENNVFPENVFSSFGEVYGYPINKFDGVIEEGVYKPNNGNNVEDPDPDLYPLASYVDSAGGQYYVYLYSIVGYVAPKGQESCNFVTRLD